MRAAIKKAEHGRNVHHRGSIFGLTLDRRTPQPLQRSVCPFNAFGYFFFPLIVAFT
jgi:hypothetical protein